MKPLMQFFLKWSIYEKSSHTHIKDDSGISYGEDVLEAMQNIVSYLPDDLPEDILVVFDKEYQEKEMVVDQTIDYPECYMF